MVRLWRILKSDFGGYVDVGSKCAHVVAFSNISQDTEIKML